MTTQEVELQRTYYSQTAQQYDQMQLSERDEHYFALYFLASMIRFFEIRSVLDVGAGTGRAVRYLKENVPGVQVLGVEPVKELIEIGHTKGLDRTELVEGDATSLAYADSSFDLVCAFGVLHHVKEPERAVAEMLRVSRKAIFISDANRFGQGSSVARTAKQVLGMMRLWKVANLIKTRGKGYTLTEGDGLAYSYSVFDNYRQIRKQCKTVHILNTSDASGSAFRSAPHVALLGIK